MTSSSILVVDDSPTQIEALRALLEDAGFHVRTALSGEDALAQLRRELPDLVLTDVVMPGISGYDLCARIKGQLGDAAPLVVLLTGLNDPRDIVRGLACHADNYITKPYEPEHLLARIHHVLENRAMQRAGRGTEGLRIRFLGEEFTISSAPEQILALLLSSFEELTRTNRALQESKRAAEAATRARDEVLAAVSHDLKNPLGTIYTSAALLLELPVTEEQRNHQLGVIRRTAERMDRLIQDLLDVSKIEAGRYSVDPVPEPVGSLLAEALELLQPIAAARRIELIDAAHSREVHVLADRGSVLRVFSNLVGNAVKFTPEGNAVTLGAERRDADVVFSVTDCGPGIPPDHLARIFERFWQARNTAAEGAGLGLAIARGIIEAHNGRIWAESDAPNGATLYFTLPVHT